MNFVKRLVLRTLKAGGYVLIKDTDARLASSPSVHSQSIAPAENGPKAAEPSEFGPILQDLQNLGFSEILQRAGGAAAISPAKAYAIHSAVRYLVDAKIPGDIVDCGEGDVSAIAIAAMSLAALGDFSRRLIVFDITGDPTHGGAHELPLWGSHKNLLDNDAAPDSSKPAASKPVLPAKLATSGYPLEKLMLLRYPVDSIEFSSTVSLLNLTSATYLANRAAISRLVPKVSTGGVIGTDFDPSKPAQRDAVAEFLVESKLRVPLWQVFDKYRIGVKT